MANYNMWIIIICFGCSTALFKKAAGSLDIGKINIVSYVYYLFLLQTFAGTALIALGYNQHYTLKYLLDYDSSIQKTFISVMAVSVFLPLGVFIFERLFKVVPSKEYKCFLDKKTENTADEFYYKIVCGLSVILVVLLAGFLVKIGYVPVVKLLTASADFDFAVERTRIGELYFVHPYVTNILILQFIPMLSYLSFTFSVLKREKKWYWIASLLFVASIITKTYKFSKAPLLFHLLVYVLIIIYIAGGVKKIYMAVFGGAMLGLMVIAYILMGFEGNFLDIYNGILGRTLFTQVGTLSYAFDLFPDYFDFLGGRSVAPTVLRLLGKSPELHLRSAKLLMDFYGSEKVYDGTGGVMNSVFIGEAYANFGYIGIALSVIWVAFVIAALFVICMKLRKNGVTITFFAVVCLKVGNITQGGFFDFIYNMDFILTLLFFGGLYLLPGIYRKIEWKTRGKRGHD